MKCVALHEIVAKEERLQSDVALYCCIAFIQNYGDMFWLVYIKPSSGLTHKDTYIKGIVYFVHTVCVRA